MAKFDTARLAPLDSPVFTTDPKGPTATAGDNDTSLATTAFVTAAIAGAGAVATISPPQGRLTLQSLTPVMTTAQASKTIIYYTSYKGNLVPIWDGTKFVMTIFGSEISVATTDTSKNPAAIGVSKVNDWFVWNDAGTVRLGHGPDWTSDTVRSAGTALVTVNGIWLNNAAITNGPAAQRGTYVGTTRSDALSQLNWLIGGSAAGGSQAFFGVWNAHNRVSVVATVTDSTASWTYSSATIIALDGSGNNRVSFVSGLAEDGIFVVDLQTMSIAVNGGAARIGVALDATNATDKIASVLSNVVTGTSTLNSVSLANTYGPQLGFHFIQATQQGDGTNTGTWFGGSQQGLSVTMRA